MIFLTGAVSFAQIGIGTNDPIATLHVKESRDSNTQVNTINSKDGIIIPRLTKQELANKTSTTYSTTSNGTLVYVKEVSSNVTGPSVLATEKIENIGFYYFDGSKWVPISGENLDDSNDAWVNNPTNSRVELGTTSDGLPRQENTQVVITDNGNLGINITNPTKRLEINAATPGNSTDVLRIKNLATPSVNVITSTLQIDSEGNVGRKSEENVEGQILRLPLKSFSVTTGNLHGIRIDQSTLNAPNGASNVINMITNSSEYEYTYPNTNVITDRIRLPAGIYRIEVKILGNFSAASTQNSIKLKTQVNGLEYSSQDFGSNTNTSGQRYTGFVATDLIKLETNSELDFIIESLQNNFNLIGAVGIGGGSSYRSLLLIQRIK